MIFRSRILHCVDRLAESWLFRRRQTALGFPFFAGKDTPVRIGSRRGTLQFPTGEGETLGHELSRIFGEDCYSLRNLGRTPRTILDIGANVGLFAFVARHRFPDAHVDCYEPNPALQPALEHNLALVQARLFPEAVGSAAGRVTVASRLNSLDGIATNDPAGTVEKVSFDTSVERLGGRVDLLKLDCEGAEWEILEHSPAIDHVAMLVTEFHLWARKDAQLSDFIRLVEQRGFEVLQAVPDRGNSWGHLHAERPLR